MNADDFELRLQRQPLRAPPAAWRGEILSAACEALRGRVNCPQPAAAGQPWVERLRDWLWPHPMAWGALVAGWVAVAALNSAADAPLIARVQLGAGSTAFLAIRAADWGDVAGPDSATRPGAASNRPVPQPVAPDGARLVPNRTRPQHLLARREPHSDSNPCHETQAA